MPVVSVQPDRQRSGAVVRGGVGLSVGPFAQGGLDKALSLAVCLGRIRLGPDVLEAEIAAGGPKRLGAIARAIVGHHTGNRDAEVRVVGDRGLEEGDRALLLLVREDLREGHPGGIVDADVDELPPDAPALALIGSIAGDAMADPVEAAELFDIDVDQFAGMLAFVAADRRGGFERLDAVEVEAPEDAADRSRRDADGSCDVLTRPALAAQGFDGRDRGCRRRPVEVMGPGGAILQAFHAFGLEARHPLVHRFDSYAESGRDGRRRLSLDHHPPHQFGSTMRRQPGILMNVHPVLRGNAEASQLQLPHSEPDGQPDESSQLARYNAHGPQALGDLRRRNGTSPSVLRPDLLDKLKARVRESPPDGGLWTGPKVAAWMAGELGLAAVLPQRGWEALKAIGWSVQKPRPRHPASATPEEREAFKKSWSRPSPRGGRSTRASRSRSGPPTSTASG